MLSVIIPTRNRVGALKCALESLMLLSLDHEIVVVDNASRDETEECLRRAPNRRVKYFRQSRPVSMAANWQTGLENATGDVVTVIGDDDLLDPRKLPHALELHDSYRGNLPVYCHRGAFYWGSFDEPREANTFIVYAGDHAALLDPSTLIDQCLRQFISYQHLPSFYNSLISRQTIEKYRSLFGGKYFPAFVISPDVFSAIAISSIVDAAVYFDTSFNISGLSNFSNGACRNETVQKEFYQLLDVCGEDRDFYLSGYSPYGMERQDFLDGINIDLEIRIAKEVDLYLRKFLMASAKGKQYARMFEKFLPLQYCLKRLLKQSESHLQGKGAGGANSERQFQIELPDTVFHVHNQLAAFRMLHGIPPGRILNLRFGDVVATSVDLARYLNALVG